jgi:hypothetical protein
VELPGIEPGSKRRSRGPGEIRLGHRAWLLRGASVVELPGIEPGSLDPVIGLLRA